MKRMRVLVAPDKFAGTLTRGRGGDAIAEGWRRRAPRRRARPGADVRRRPRFRRRPARGARRRARRAARSPAPTAPRSRPRSSSAAARRTSRARRPAGCTSSPPERARPRAGLDVRRRAAGRRGPGGGREPGRRRARRLGDQRRGSGAARGARSGREPAGALEGGPRTLEDAGRGGPERRRAPGCAGVEIVAATDVDNPLLGLIGATNVYGPQKGIAEERLHSVDAALERLAAATDKRLALGKGAGAAGGLGSRCCCSAPPASRVSGWWPRPSASRAGPRQPTSWSPGRVPSTSPPARARCPTASPRSPQRPLRPCIALAGKVLVGVAGDAGARGGVGLRGRRPRGGGGVLRRPGREPRRWPSGSPGPGPGDPRRPRARPRGSRE